jgi:hypothetical protein
MIVFFIFSSPLILVIVKTGPGLAGSFVRGNLSHKLKVALSMYDQTFQTFLARLGGDEGRRSLRADFNRLSL